MLKGTVAGVAGLAAAGGVVGTGLYLTNKNHVAGAAGIGDSGVTQNQLMQNQMMTNPQLINNQLMMNPRNNAVAVRNILNIAVTAEMLGVTFYKRVLMNANALDLGPNARRDIQAALIEEQLHQNFLMQQGAKPLTKMFSFPQGRNTFLDFNAFFQTQQLLESAFVAAYLAAVKEFAMLGRPDLAQIASQIGGVEAEHRAIGRVIAAKAPANNLAFEQIMLKRVADAPAVLKNAGFLTPTNTNSWGYTTQQTAMDGVKGTTPWG
jgi:hypothetical protein